VKSSDTIAAIASAPGRGAIGIIRISGAGVPGIVRELLGAELAPRMACLSRFRAADGSVLDEGLALFFPAPASFTGEHVLELQGHGGAVVLDLLMQRLLELGCRMARAGDFRTARSTLPRPQRSPISSMRAAPQRRAPRSDRCAASSPRASASCSNV
jgi:tRNA modification GTPase